MYKRLGTGRGMQMCVVRTRSIVVAVVFVFLCIGAEASGQEFEFRFNPPDSVAFLRTVKNTKVQSMDSLESRTDVTEGTERIVITKTPDGYKVSSTALSSSMTRNGITVNDPIMSQFLNMTVTYDLDAEGQLLAVHGYDKVINKMKESLPPEAVKSLAAVLNEDALINKEAAEWNGRIGGFIGRTAKIGDVWTSTDEFPLPTGEAITSYSATKFVEDVKCGSHDCISIQFWYNSDAGALQSLVGEMASDVADSAGAPQLAPEISGASIIGEGERIIDPATMLIYSEKVSRTMKMQIEAPGRGKVMVTSQEVREMSFDYIK